jgi:hypothetical protein
MNFYKVKLVYLFLMDIGEVVKKVLADLVSGLPNEMPPVMTVSGGGDDIRGEIMKGLREKTGSEVVEGSDGKYTIPLGYFIKKYDPSFC